MLVVGNVIGSAIFLTTGAMVEALPSASLVLAAWLAGGLMACAGGLTFAEMGAMLPRSGGMYVFLEEAYGPLVAFLFGWTMVLVVLPGGTAAVAVGFAESFSYFFPSLSTTRLLMSIPLPLGALTISAGQVVAALSIAALASANLFGVAAASRVAALVTMLKVVAVVAIPIVAIAAWPHTPALMPIVPPVARPLAAFGVAMIAVMWAYEGWAYLAFAAGEVHDPSRTLPRCVHLRDARPDRRLCAGERRLLHCAAARGDQRRDTGGREGDDGGRRSLGATLVAGHRLPLDARLQYVGCAGHLAGGVRDGGRRHVLPVRSAGAPEVPHAARRPARPGVLVVCVDALGQLRAAVHVRDVRGGAVQRARGAGDLPAPQDARASRAPVSDVGLPGRAAGVRAGSIGLVVNTLLERPAESMAGLLLMAAGLPAYAYWRRGASALTQSGLNVIGQPARDAGG